MEDALRLSRDGGIVCALFLMAAAIAYALFTAVEVFAEASYKAHPRASNRFIAGFVFSRQRKLG